MAAPYGAGLASSAATDSEARKIVGAGARNEQFSRPAQKQTQAIRADLRGSNEATALGIVVRAHAPVLEICRRLIGAGFDPATSLDAWRGDTLALTVHSVGEAAKVEVSPRGVGFVRRPAVRGGAHVAENGGLPELPWPGITDAA